MKKKRKQKPATISLAEKLIKVRDLGVAMILGKIEAYPVDLSAHGIAPTLLTDELLLTNYVASSLEVTTLHILTLVGCLSQIPEKCLHPRLVLKHSRYHAYNSAGYENFLNFCARHSFYRELPNRYQNSAALLHRSSKFRHETPIQTAASHRQLHRLPLDLLKPGDIDSNTLRLAFSGGQLECLNGLITADDFCHDALLDYFRSRQVVQSVEETLGAQRLLSNQVKGTYRRSILLRLIIEGRLKRLSAKLFLNDFQLVFDTFQAGIKYLKIIDARPTRIKNADQWLLQFSNEVCKKASSRFKRQ